MGEIFLSFIIRLRNRLTGSDSGNVKGGAPPLANESDKKEDEGIEGEDKGWKVKEGGKKFKKKAGKK